MKHTKQCGAKRGEHMKHVYVLDRVAIGGYLTQRCVTMLWDTCARCGTWLPLGPSDETPVAVEVRAAELAAAWTPERGTSDGASLGEEIGWLMHAARGDIEHQPGTDAHHAGYLAHVIAHHDAEQTPSAARQAHHRRARPRP